MSYLLVFTKVLLKHRLIWWLGLMVASAVGYGFGEDYLGLRVTLSERLGMDMPTNPFFWVLVMMLIWLVLTMAHNEVQRIRRAGRLVISDPVTIQTPLYHKAHGHQTGQIDIILAFVRNKPIDNANGRDVDDAFCEILIEDLTDGSRVLLFHYPRWEANPKPGYDGIPNDRYEDQWHYRTLKANSSPNRIDLIVRPLGDDNAYGFQGESQKYDSWANPLLAIPPGRYRVKLTIYGKGMYGPYETHYEFINPGRGKTMLLRRNDRGSKFQWLPGNT
jgi:hypothetical protein